MLIKQKEVQPIHLAYQPDKYQRYFEAILDAALKRGDDGITLRTADGENVLGTNSENSENIDLTVYDNAFFRRVISTGNLGMGESFMDGQFSVANGKLPELLTCLLKHRIDQQIRGNWQMALRYGGLLLTNTLFGRKNNVRRHYDIGDSLFNVFLEDDYKVYSCGYAKSDEDTIADLQTQKLDRICQKLKLCEGATLLDVGCGNGGLLIHAAKNYGVKATGITNSKSHAARTIEHAQKYGVENMVSVVLGDFSEVEGQYDRIVSVGMLEHVPQRAYGQYFRMISQRLSPTGWVLVHAIGKNAAINRHDPFIQKYIFPGSDTPKLSAISNQIESQNMAIMDVENMVRHYAITCRRWLDAFNINKHKLEPSYYDEPFKRMWEYYLACGIAVALAGDLSVYQILFTKDYHLKYAYQRV